MGHFYTSSWKVIFVNFRILVSGKGIVMHSEYTTSITDFPRVNTLRTINQTQEPYRGRKISLFPSIISPKSYNAC